jgi:hypothetical protein
MTQAQVDQNESEYKAYLKQVGQCEFWDPKPFIDAANILVAADEPMRALKLLDEVPGYYRDNPDPQMTSLKEKILSLLATPAFYATNPYDTLVREEVAEHVVDSLVRGVLIRDDVKRFNDQGLTPHIVDLGPGEYWLPIGLKKKGLQFTYHDVGLCKEAQDKAYVFIKDRVRETQSPGQPVIFVACEIIEHMHHEEDIAVEYHRLKANADVIHISTPKYTFDIRKSQLDWEKKGDLGHLRTYTPKEFFDVVSKMFPQHQFVIYEKNAPDPETGEQLHLPVMHMRGERKRS